MRGKSRRGAMSGVVAASAWCSLVFAAACQPANETPEEAMAGANRKFRRRFTHVEERVREGRGSFEDYTLEELDAFWDEAKRLERM